MAARMSRRCGIIRGSSSHEPKPRCSRSRAAEPGPRTLRGKRFGRRMDHRIELLDPTVISEHHRQHVEYPVSVPYEVLESLASSPVRDQIVGSSVSGNTTTVVSRRYREFLWLQKQLHAEVWYMSVRVQAGGRGGQGVGALCGLRCFSSLSCPGRDGGRRLSPTPTPTPTPTSCLQTPGAMVPVLPQKNIVGNLDERVISARQRHLQRSLNQ